MENDKFDEKTKITIFKRKIRCNLCHEIPIIKDILISNGVTGFVTAECLNRHGVFLCPIKDFCDDKYQLDHIKCSVCNVVQKVINCYSKLFIFCKECNQFFCPKCSKPHFQKYLKTHHALSLYEFDYKCRLHMGHYSCFCVKCNMNLCPLCYQREHYKHEKIIHFDKIKPNEKVFIDIKFKIDEQKAQIYIISEYLENVSKFIAKKIDEYKSNLKMALKLNFKIFNCYNKDKLNYQSIVNFPKVIDIDITDISFIKEIEDELAKFVDMIKTKSSYKILSADKETPTPNIDKELLQTVKESLGSTSKNLPLNDFIENRTKEKKEVNEFLDNELLEKIGKTNKKILNEKDIIGEIKKIYSLDIFGIYLLIIENGIFIYEQETNNIINYIDINEGFEYNEINKSALYYKKEENLIFLFLSTIKNTLLIYTIDEKEEFDYKLNQILKLEKINNIAINANGELIIFDGSKIFIYEKNDDLYKRKKEIENDLNKKVKYLFDTENYLIVSTNLDKIDEISFYDKINLGKIFSLENFDIDDKTKIFEISKNYICIAHKSKINIINLTEKKMCYSYEKKDINYMECLEVINNKILASCKNKDNKLILLIMEWDDKSIVLREKEAIDELECKMICKINENKAILYTKYGLNLLELKN